MVCAALVMDWLCFFPSEHSFFTGHSHVLIPSFFVDFGPMYFMGIDTYINI